MATETTQPSYLEPRPIGAQGPAADALVELVKMFGQLPGGYVKIHAQRFASCPVKLEFQLEAPHEFEQWRAALAIAPDSVQLASGASYVWLAAEGMFHGVAVSLTGFGVPLSAELVNTPQVVDETASAVAA